MILNTNVEIWKDIPNYEGYYKASNYGRVKSMPRKLAFGCAYRMTEEKILKESIAGSGYLFVCLCKDGVHKQIYVHRLVWYAFNGDIPEGMDVNHINEVKTDNRLSNLNLMTRKENCNWGNGKERMLNSRKGRNARKAVLQFDLNGKLIKEYPSIIAVQRELGYKNSSIGDCCRNKKHFKTAYGYVWKFK